jgi:glycosyltransferase involved in cell wall biosynthesis
MTIQTLVSALCADQIELIDKMNLQTDSILVNQCQEFSYIERRKGTHRIQCYNLNERGLGLSRNHALLRGTADILLFSDDDIRYVDGYGDLILAEFQQHPEADMIFFNVNICEARKTYENHSWKPVHLLGSGRYPTYSMAVRREKVQMARISFSLFYGGGAKFSNGEDSLFIKDCLHAGLKAYASPVCIGTEEERESTWFQGYHEKFFYDRGVLYHDLYGKFALIFGFRFVFFKRKVICNEISAAVAFKLLRKGIREQKMRR